MSDTPKHLFAESESSWRVPDERVKIKMNDTPARGGRVNENSFTPTFLASLSVLELAVLQHELRRFAEDAENLCAVLAEFKRREVPHV